MTQLLERPPHEPSPLQTARTLFGAGDRGRSVQIGLVLAVIIWCGLLFLIGAASRHLVGELDPSTTFTESPKPSFEIELESEESIMPKKEPPPPDRFVETNPDAPENIPDKTRNFAAQNQQAAQEKPTPDGKSDTPATEGEKEMENITQIVNGELTPPELPPPPSPPPTPEMMQAIQEAQAQREQDPLAGTEKVTGDSASGYGFNIAKPSEAPTDVAEKVEGQKDAPLIAGAPQLSVPRIDPQQPQPRPRINNVRARPAVLADNPLGTQNIGNIAFDARWSNYGQYLQQLIETVQIQWERIMRESRAYPPAGSECEVKFRIDSSGNVSEIISTKGNGGAQYERACQLGITSRAPYGKWTDDMIAVLGESQELTFTFYIH